ncbi:phenylalanine 4-monooxygenase [Streptomyces sp. UNOC14_S4]|uniref:phenylalanine 4-monooxygenase n=1 Tax=Streptomyces sp. UNOC14_S4 TaxID=2872340 RepID=UPI001E28E223|nr:phenylalanine 4-monooxygenase [Streptomyces sp. UNOC14_S4]MCC3767016.1 phenylalanine 4-monooxygenase [Streptomyces sp. UNOC14_S4]
MSDARRRTPVTPDGRLGTAAEHPGRRDARYRERRNALARPARGHRVGDPVPYAAYTESEHATWRTVRAALADAHSRYACAAVLEAATDAPIPADRIPQLADVGAALRPLTGFDFTLTGGLVEDGRFFRSLDLGYFHAVQYVRHPAVPLYTPEPDVIHDVVGHGIHLSSPRFAELYRLFGQAAVRVRTPEALTLLNRVYWFTLEAGVVAEGGGVKAYGAALLSSSGELARLDECDVRELDPGVMARTRYLVSGYQRVLFRARSLDHLTETLTGFLAGFDDEWARETTMGTGEVIHRPEVLPTRFAPDTAEWGP